MFDYYSRDGVTLMVEFKCMRHGCENTYIGPLQPHMARDEGDRYIRNLILPQGWDRWCGWLLCPECNKGMRNYLRGEEVEI